MTSNSFDLVIRIALLRAHDDPRELVPNIWRRFRCSSEINLDAFQDKILQPLMGWTRNYHTYYFQKSRTFYFQSKSAASDAFGMHDSHVAQGKRLDPESVSIGNLLSIPGDSCFYGYDLGDHWYHKVTLEKVIRKSDIDESNEEEMALFGKCLVLDGAMRCPDEDGEGGSTYQNNILDCYNNKKADPSNVPYIRKYAEACFEVTNATNVRGLFDAEEFSVAATQQAVHDALRSRQSYRMGNKTPNMMRSMMEIERVQAGQRKIKWGWQDTRGEKGGPMPKPFFVPILEIINVKPDDDKFALCCCGNPCKLSKCGACQTQNYCSKGCQKGDWKLHKKGCKQDKAYYQAHLKEKAGETAVPQDTIDLGNRLLKRYDPLNMRFKVGQKVECLIGSDIWGQGNVKQVLHEYDGTTHAYQVELDMRTARRAGFPINLIWAELDCDYQIRAIDQDSGGKNAASNRSTHSSNHPNMESVD
jgi:hypothetical protein